MDNRICVVKGCKTKAVKKEFVCKEHIKEAEDARRVNGVFCSVCHCALPDDWITTLCYACG